MTMQKLKNKITVLERRIKCIENDNSVGASSDYKTTVGTEISFETNKIYNTNSLSGTGDITDDLTNAQLGVVQKIYHNDSVDPTFPVGWVLLGSGVYTINVLNIIYAEWVSGTRVEYWIIQEA